MRKPQKYLERGIIYQINLRSFTNEGTLNAAAKLLPHIRKFADIVYLCPCFVQDDDENREFWSDRTKASKLENPLNPYRISDYYNVDPEYGTGEDLKNFVAVAHEVGLRVILDLVYFHCGPNAVFIKDHPDFIVRDADGKPDMGQWHYPKLNFGSKGLREYLIGNMELFVRDYKVDGYRCDVGDAVPLDFWAEARDRIDAINPDLMMLNEGGKPDYIDVFDLNYCWNLRSALKGVIEDGKPASTVRDSLLSFSRNNLQSSFQSILFMENHDSVNDDYENRLESRIGSEAMDACFVVNYLLPNVPFVYCGTEIADTNRHSIWGNRFHSANLTIDWQNLTTEAGERRLRLLQKLSALRHGLPEVGLSEKLEFVDTDSEKVLAFFRGEGDNRLAVVVNLSAENVRVSVDAGGLELEPWLISKATLSLAGTEGRLTAALAPFGYAVVELH